MSEEQRSRYRLTRGRPSDGRLTAPATRTAHIPFPMELFQAMVDESREPDVSQELSNVIGGGYLADFVRASVLTFIALLNGPTRDRVLAFANLSEEKMATVTAHLAFHYDRETLIAAAMDEQPAGEAPLDERDPWNKL